MSALRLQIDEMFLDVTRDEQFARLRIMTVAFEVSVKTLKTIQARLDEGGPIRSSEKIFVTLTTEEGGDLELSSVLP